MKDFIFYIPTEIHFGKDTEKMAGSMCRKYGRHVMIIYGSDRIEKTGFLEAVEADLKAHDLTCIRCGGVKENPSLDFVRMAIEKFRKEEADCILAIGGGSVIDTAKAISIGVPSEHDVWDFFEGKAEPGEAIPVGVILTMAATASEANCVVVLTNDEKQHKLAYGHPMTYPRFALMNPSLTCTVSAKQTAIGAIDIFAHAFERYFHRGQKSVLRDRLCVAVMQTVLEVLPKVLEHPDDYDGRSQLMWAATMAHSDMIGSEGVFACHEMSHVLTEIYGIAHGEALSILMPAWCKYMLPKYSCEIATFSKEVWKVEAGDQKAEKVAEEGIWRFQHYLSNCGLAVTLREAGYKDMDPELLLGHLFDGRDIIGEAFETIDKDAAKMIFDFARG